ncbi:uncharacterized protein TRAVEDRAFT_16965 [Trametes versicolor FP-101664 SS1]|uniref:uncharacterized protein n=1 Tax=Trametes versicolor (strain FP-101664) TaxID=717944 RepID=UPI0004621920|nr:uncharacterized protein TRAVEDRAFT_16965 [Trametes versicolor FP-101664 SS1]EIW65136.1 hypothetical protein TRAVEDRAFT_16965 [Trametes versicolor FP-101664 SS1]
MSTHVRCTCESICKLENAEGVDIPRHEERMHRRKDLMRGSDKLQRARGVRGRDDSENIDKVPVAEVRDRERSLIPLPSGSSQEYIELRAEDDHDIEDMYYTPTTGPNQLQPASAAGRHTEHTPPLLSPPALQSRPSTPSIELDHGLDASSHTSGTHPSEEGMQLGLYDDADADADEDELELQARLAQLDVARPEPAAIVEPAAEHMDGLSGNDASQAGEDVVILPGSALDEGPVQPHSSLEAVDLLSHEKWFVRTILLMVTYLHTRHHITFRSATIILFTTRAIFIALGVIDLNDPMPKTFTTALKRLDLTDRFHIFPTCPQCHRLFRPDIAPSTLCPVCKTPLFSRGALAVVMEYLGAALPHAIPRFAAPFRPLSAAILDFLSRPHMDIKVDEWRNIPSIPGEYRRIQDGRIWKTLKGHDGLPFFGPQAHGEIRIGVIYHLDWYIDNPRLRSPFAPSHSSGILSCSIANLDRLLRYCMQYMMPCAMTPGPNEPDAEELQYYQELLIEDLLILYYEGITAPTYSHPHACICASLDHPGMCKSGGFADKNHNEDPCPKCEAKLAEMYTWITRSQTEGLVKNQWYTHWIRGNALRADTDAGTKRELKVLHNFLASVALSADEYKNMALHPGVIVIPILWERFLPASHEEHQRALKTHQKAMDAWKKANDAHKKATVEHEAPKVPKAKKAKVPKPMPPPAPPVPRMHAGEVDLFLKLSTALKLILASSVTDETRRRGCQLLHEYLVDYGKLYGIEKMVPNHHFALHTEPQLEDYGTVYDIWAFLAERLNKLFKSFNLNNWGGGQLEITMMQSFLRDVDLQATVQCVASMPAEDPQDVSQEIATYLLKDTREARGTIEAAAAVPGAPIAALHAATRTGAH